MLLETRLDDRTALYIDCDAVSGVNKADMTTAFHPDDVMDHVVRFTAGIAGRLATAAEDGASAMPPPRKIDLEFSIRVDSNATVSIGRNPTDGQFKVRVSWEP